MTLFTTSRPTISVKSVTRYPTRITTGTGLSYTYTNGTLNISLDYSDIPDSAQIADPANYTTVVYNKTTGLLEEVQLDYIPTTVVTDPVYTRGDSNFTIPSDYRVLSLVANLTASRTWTLPLAADVTSGNRIFIYDTVGGISATNTLVIAAPSGNTINGASSITLSNAFAGITIVSNSGTQWTAILTNVDSVGGLGTNVANAMKQPVNAASGLVRLDSSGNVPALNGAALTSLNASNLGSGTVPAARLPGPTLSTIGGVKAKAAETSKFVNQIDTDGSVNLAQPAFSDISGSVAASQLPNPSATTLGGVQAKAAVSNQFLTQIGTDGSVSSAQPAVSGLSGLGTGVATFLATPSSANLASAVTDETGTGALVFANSPTLVTPALGTPASGNLANCTFPTLNQNTTGTAAGLSATLATSSGGTGLGGATPFTSGYIPYASSSSALSFSSGLRSDGTNIGLGVTPSAWSNGYKSLQVGGAGFGLSAANSAQGIITQNAVYNGGWKYVTADYANYIEITGGSYRWLTAPSGTAGGTINAPGGAAPAWVQAMTLDASGRLGVGVTSPTATLHVKGGNTNNLKIDNNGEQYTELDFLNNGTAKAYIYWDNTNSNWYFRSLGTLQLASSGGSGATIDASGNLLVGTTTTQQRLTVYSDGSGGTAYIRNTNTALGGNLVDVRADRNTTNGSYQYFACYNQTAAAYKMYVIDSGKIYSTDTAIGSISDARHKENIRDLDVGLDAITQLKPRRFDWKANKGTGKKDVAGFIAQEVEPIFPDLIDAWKDAETPDLKALSMGGMVPAIVKAIQELAAKVSALEARI